MANPFKFRADHLGPLVSPPSAGDTQDATIQALKMQRDAGLSIASDGGFGRSNRASAQLASGGGLANAIAAELAFIHGHNRMPVKVVIPSPSRLAGDDGVAPIVAFRAAVAAAIAGGAAYVQIDAAGPAKQQLAALQTDLTALADLPRPESTRLALNYAGESLEDIAASRFDLLKSAPVDRLILTFRNQPDFSRLAAIDERVDIALAILPIAVDAILQDQILSDIDRAATVVDGDRLAIAPRHGLAQAGIDWARQYEMLWMVTDTAMRWWGFES